MSAEDLIAKLSAPASVATPANAPAPPQPWVPMCTPCLLEAKQAQQRGTEVPEIHGVAVIANGMGLCEVRHQIQVEPPKLLLAQPGQMPNGFGA